MTRFYISARFGRQAEARAAAEEITRATGWECTARWLTATTDDDTRIHTDLDAMCDAAAADLQDIDHADIMFTITEDLDQASCMAAMGLDDPLWIPVGWARGGRHVELGYALSRDMQIILIGPRENIFHGLLERVDTVEDAITAARNHVGEATA